VGFNDVDFCIRVTHAGYRNVFTPHAQLTHYESISRGLSGYYQDYQEFLRRWSDVLRAGDPYYNPNLSRLEPWCPMRPPGEDATWLAMVDGLVAQDPSPHDPPPVGEASAEDMEIAPGVDEARGSALVAER